MKKTIIVCDACGEMQESNTPKMYAWTVQSTDQPGSEDSTPRRVNEVCQDCTDKMIAVLETKQIKWQLLTEVI